MKEYAGIRIGNRINKGTAKEITNQMIKILKTSAGDDVKKKALEMLASVTEIKNISISGCNIQMGKKK